MQGLIEAPRMVPRKLHGDRPTLGNAIEPRVSIVVPTWNRKDLVGACLKSLGAQAFFELAPDTSQWG